MAGGRRRETLRDEPLLKRLHGGALAYGTFQQRALDLDPDRVRRLIALAPAPPSVGGFERGQHLGAEARRARCAVPVQRLHRSTAPARREAATIVSPSGYPRPCGRR